tara:strand:+ start:344 stop:1012 length:669 start_codon:yes stop_codon:yes gene_type:complete
MISLDDTDCWLKYPKHRWVFNKLDVALRLNYDAGPACVPVNKSNNYVIRPTYNLYGMGIGAIVQYIDVEDNDKIINNDIIPPGYFWCEYFEGDHYSIDYIYDNGIWKQFNIIVGINSKNNLTKFEKWTRIDNNDIALPEFIHNISDVEYLNIETKGDKIIEIHLRTGNDVLHDAEIGSSIIPLWRGDEHMIDNTFIPNDQSEKLYNASGHLNDVRIGYIRET